MRDDRKAERRGGVVEKHPQECESDEEQSEMRHPPNHRRVAGVPRRLRVLAAGAGAFIGGERLLHFRSTNFVTKTKRKETKRRILKHSLLLPFFFSFRLSFIIILSFFLRKSLFIYLIITSTLAKFPCFLHQQQH